MVTEVSSGQYPSVDVQYLASIHDSQRSLGVLILILAGLAAPPYLLAYLFLIIIQHEQALRNRADWPKPPLLVRERSFTSPAHCSRSLRAHDMHTQLLRGSHACPAARSRPHSVVTAPRLHQSAAFSADTGGMELARGLAAVREASATLFSLSHPFLTRRARASVPKSPRPTDFVAVLPRTRAYSAPGMRYVIVCVAQQPLAPISQQRCCAGETLLLALPPRRVRPRPTRPANTTRYPCTTRKGSALRRSRNFLYPRRLSSTRNPTRASRRQPEEPGDAQ